jgi:hypothetical protein
LHEKPAARGLGGVQLAPRRFDFDGAFSSVTGDGGIAAQHREDRNVGASATYSAILGKIIYRVLRGCGRAE